MLSRRYCPAVCASLIMGCSSMLLGRSVCAQDYTFQDVPPTGAPTSTCTVKPDADGSKLRVLTGTAPVTFVFACGHNRPAGQCAVMTMKPGGREMPTSTRFATQGQEQNGWTCVDEDGIMGWLPSERLISLPSTPAIPLQDWMGWWREGPDAHGIKSDRLLIARGKVPGTLHVSGRAYWYGANDNVHLERSMPMQRRMGIRCMSWMATIRELAC